MNILTSACWISNKSVNLCYSKLIKINFKNWLTDGIIPIPVYWRQDWRVSSWLNFNQPLIWLGSIEVLDCICLDSRAAGINSYPWSPVFGYWHNNDTIYPLPCSTTVAKLEGAHAGHKRMLGQVKLVASTFENLFLKNNWRWEFTFKENGLFAFFQK